LAIERAKLYEELKEYSEHLEQKVEERTRELREAQQQLIQSEKLAAIGQLAAGVAHEINNPLANISMYTQMLMEKEKDSARREKLEVIEGQVGIAARIVGHLLDFSRQSEPKTTQLDLNKEILETLSFLNHQMYISNIEIVKDLDADLPKIYADSGQLRQVFLNLISNAIEAMPRGGRLTLSTKKEDGEIEIGIADTGVGIPKEDISKIFDPFFSTRGVGKGTGLGLSVSLGIIERHAGRIEVESEVGVGTKFTIKLPIEGMR
ncbi:MAG: sensor histidine kinase, partial [Candidatus Hydrothermarchaeales archaeon]